MDDKREASPLYLADHDRDLSYLLLAAPAAIQIGDRGGGDAHVPKWVKSASTPRHDRDDTSHLPRAVSVWRVGADGGVSVGGVTTSACCGAVSGYRGDKKASATCNRPMGKHHRKTVEMSLTRMDGVMMEMCTSTRVFC
jgi:hypothetical protein